MRKTIYTCDHCDKEINPMNDYTDTEINDFDFIKKVDLCNDCFKQLSNIVRQFIKAN